jgi:hypothetical protein
MTNVIVNDGEVRWVADKAALVAALDAAGWKQTSTYHGAARTEPASGDDEDSAYTRLCGVVKPVDVEQTEDMPEFVWAPDVNAWVWVQ